MLLKLFLAPVAPGTAGRSRGLLKGSWWPLIASNQHEHTDTMPQTQHALALSAADIYEHVATILPNVTRFSAGRQLLLQPGRGLLQALASQVSCIPAAPLACCLPAARPRSIYRKS